MTHDSDPQGFTHLPLYLPACIGVLVSIGQMLNSDEPLTWRHAIGRCIVTAALAMSSYCALIWVPHLPDIAIVGFASALATLGTEGILRLAKLYAPKKGE